MSKRKDLSAREKKELLEKYDALPKCSQRDAATSLGVPQTTLGRLLRQRDQIVEKVASHGNIDRKRKREGKCKNVEDALLEWFKKARLMNAPINRGILMEKAEDFARKLGKNEFAATNGWLTRWKERHNIVYKKVHGESQDADKATAKTWVIDVLQPILSEYAPEQIYNTDETALFYRALPTHATVFKHECPSAGKKQKDRVTLLFTCNMTGTKKKTPLMIGKSKNPRCFRGTKRLPVEYQNNKNAWMTAKIFTDFLLEWDRQLKREKIVLILDNCTAHPNVSLKNIRMVFLPPNTTSVIQPLDQGIIKTFKTFYRQDMRRKIIDSIDNGEGSATEIAKKMTLLDGIFLIRSAWEKVSEKCISNCFRKAGFKKDSEQGLAMDDSEESIKEDSGFSAWVDIDQDACVSEEKSDEDIIEEILASEQATEEDADSEEEVLAPPPTSAEIRDALATLRQALVHAEGSTEINFQNFCAMERDFECLTRTNLKQSTLDAFFSSAGNQCQA